MLAKNSLGYFVAMFTTTMALSKKLTETTMRSGKYNGLLLTLN